MALTLMQVILHFVDFDVDHVDVVDMKDIHLVYSIEVPDKIKECLSMIYTATAKLI